MNWLSRAIRFYTLNTPLERGKYRLSEIALNLAGAVPPEQIVYTRDGRTLVVDTRSSTYRHTYFTGEYEPAITRLLMDLVEPGDVCLDVGANIGWHTTLLASCSRRSVHAFEPVLRPFDFLTRNIRLSPWGSNIRANRLALSDRQGEARLHVFNGLPEGHSSQSPMGREDFEVFAAPMTTLDSYRARHQPEAVDVIKLDIEGAELAFLKGASSLFSQSRPPLMIIEMAMATLTHFGNCPNDLLDFINGQTPYEFYVIDEVKSACRKFERFPPDHIGANVLCVPSGHFSDRMTRCHILI